MSEPSAGGSGDGAVAPPCETTEAELPSSGAALSKRARKKLAKQEDRKHRKQEHHEQNHGTMLADARQLRTELQRRRGAVSDAALYAQLPRSSECELFDALGSEAVERSPLFSAAPNSWRSSRASGGDGGGGAGGVGGTGGGGEGGGLGSEERGGSAASMTELDPDASPQASHHCARVPATHHHHLPPTIHHPPCTMHPPTTHHPPPTMHPPTRRARAVWSTGFCGVRTSITRSTPPKSSRCSTRSTGSAGPPVGPATWLSTSAQATPT